MPGSLTLRVITPEAILLDEKVESVVVPASDGLTGILPRHAPMVVALAPGSIKYSRAGSAQRLFVAGGFAEVHGDTVRVITQASERPSEIDVERAERAAGRARERLRTGQASPGEDLDVLRAEFALRRALERLRTAQFA
jgi:F-type H+-transporting ATPase subunit epsilon